MQAIMLRAERKLALAEASAEARRVFLRTIFHEVSLLVVARLNPSSAILARYCTLQLHRRSACPSPPSCCEYPEAYDGAL
jgi:hypothetical protein